MTRGSSPAFAPAKRSLQRTTSNCCNCASASSSTINAAASGYDAMLMPTTPDTAPTIAEAGKDDESYFRLNGRMLRNPSIVNLFDGCALSVPCHDPGSAPVGLMIAGTQNTDRKILAIGLAVEAALR